MWPMLTDPAAHGGSSNVSAAHQELWLSAEVLLRGDLKLVVAQQQPAKTNNPPTYGWKCGGTGHPRCNTLNSSAEVWVEPTPEQCECGCAFKTRTNLRPCLFNVTADPSEFHDLSGKHPTLQHAMWETLNNSNLELYARAPGPRLNGSSPPHLLGTCNATCSAAFWNRYSPGAQSSECGVPGCS